MPRKMCDPLTHPAVILTSGTHTRCHTTERQPKIASRQHFYQNAYIFICMRFNFQPEKKKKERFNTFPACTHSSLLLHLSQRGQLVSSALHAQRSPAPLPPHFPRDENHRMKQTQHTFGASLQIHPLLN